MKFSIERILCSKCGHSLEAMESVWRVLPSLQAFLTSAVRANFSGSMIRNTTLYDQFQIERYCSCGLLSVERTSDGVKGPVHLEAESTNFTKVCSLACHKDRKMHHHCTKETRIDACQFMALHVYLEFGWPLWSETLSGSTSLL